MQNGSWIIGLPILAAALTACGGGSGSSTDSSSGSASSAPGTVISSSSASSGGTGSTGSGGTATSPPPASIPGSTTNLTAPMGQAAAARLLMQGTFGATQDTISGAAGQSYNAWFAAQAAQTVSTTLPSVTTASTDWSPAWFNNATLGPDQLRQRMAFALSQIMVVSANGTLASHNSALAYYYDLLAKDSLGNFRQLLEDVTLSPAMGEFLSVLRNDKPNPATNVHADQNYAREVMQLFTVGLVKLYVDGSVQTDSSGNEIATYGPSDVLNLANVLTGFSSAPTTHTGEQAWLYDLNETTQMVAYADHHDSTDAKTIIGGVQIPAGGTATSDLKVALDTLFNHPNVGPFIGKQLIQHLVTSNPSPAYVQRVAQVFNNDGTGVRGNLLAVAEAILTDQEAVSTPASNTYGKLREPLIRVTNLWRAFNSYSSANQVDDPTLLIYAYQWFNEYPLDAPSVFNFFQPGYQLAGPLTNAGLVAPEFQITNEATLVNTDNALQTQSYQYVDSAGNTYAGPDYSLVGQLSAATPYLHTAQWESLAANPGALVDEMNLVLMAGQMSADMRTALVNYATAIPAASAAARVAETAELLVTAPEFAIQR